MDRDQKIQKILSAAPKLKRDRLIPSSTHQELPAPVAAQPRKADHEKKATIFPRKLQIPVTVEQELTLDHVAKRLQGNRQGRGGDSINSNTVARSLLRLLDGIQITEGDVALSEQEVFQLLKSKLGIG
jgi:hypothetical protein